MLAGVTQRATGGSAAAQISCRPGRRRTRVGARAVCRAAGSLVALGVVCEQRGLLRAGQCGMPPGCSGVLVLGDRVLPVLVGKLAAAAGVRCRYPESFADLRPGVPVGEGGGHGPGEEFLGQLGGGDQYWHWHARTVVFRRARWAVCDEVRHLDDGIGASTGVQRLSRAFPHRRGRICTSHRGFAGRGLCRCGSVVSALVTIEQTYGSRTAATDVVPAGGWGSAPELSEEAAARIAGAVAGARSEGTRRTYASAWRLFAAWCTAQGHPALPAHLVTVAAYLVDAADTYTRAGEPTPRSRWPGGSPRSVTITAPPGIPPRTPTTWCAPRCPGSAATTPPMETAPAPHARRCWSTGVQLPIPHLGSGLGRRGCRGGVLRECLVGESRVHGGQVSAASRPARS